jgi:hypothetical protein
LGLLLAIAMLIFEVFNYESNYFRDG